MMDLNKIFPLKLRSARRILGLTQKELAVSSGVSHHSIGKYEKGVRLPSSGAMMDLAKALKVEVGYFFSESHYPIEDIEVEYREGFKIGTTDEGFLKLEAQKFLEKYISIEELSESRKDFENPLTHRVVINTSEAEQSAIELRKKLKLGDSPIHNLTDFLDRIGIKVLMLDYGDNFEGFSAWIGKVPLIVVNPSGKVVPRLRFTLAHELAHLVLTIPKGIQGKDREAICDAFAGAFLMPKSVLIDRIGRNRKTISLEELRALQESYGISKQSLGLRLVHCKIIGWNDYHELLQVEDFGNYSKKEESARYFQLLYKLILEETVDREQAQYLSNVSPQDFETRLKQAETIKITVDGNLD
ncbi:ImmA/IrrE family metallo-endopeptidase [Echinicola soli]|uniref:ImmA/IrrE family metallo-endopeptidase n=1 Tax=Echinicola soli TaxID=2591634 RepID=A0A514CFX7_9BACT|nr:XRE family transcriptional regulator [Echinicola soli]QDH78727.1 ImmA/IrrE family metallo-endopeptidase [Echinicola soli]